MSNFAARLDELMERATKGPWTKGFAHWGRYQISAPNFNVGEITSYNQPEYKHLSESNADLIIYLVNHAPAIRDLVVAARIMCGQSEGDDLEAEANMIEALAKLEEE